MDGTLAEALLAERAALLATSTLVLLLLAAWIVLIAVLTRWMRIQHQEIGRAVQRFEDIADVSGDWVWETDDQHRFTYFSDRLFQLIGYRPEKFLGRARIDVAGERAEDSRWRAHLEDLRQRRPFREFPYEIVDAHGQRRLLHVSGKPVFDHSGTFLGYRGTGTDVTASVKAQEAARLAERRATTIIEASPDAFVSVQADGKIIDWNGRAEALFGWSREEAVGRTIADLAASDSPCAAVAAAGRRFTPRPGSREGRSRRVEMELTDRQGNPVPVEVTFTTVAGEGGGVSYAAFIRDIGKQREAARALREAKEVAEVANRSKSEFLAAMSHELRTPLNAVIGFSEVMEAGLLGPLPARYQSYAQDIRESGQHLLEVINDILDISKVEAGAIELNEEAVDPKDLMKVCLRLVGERARRAGVYLENALPPDAPSLWIDPQRIKQILLNLLSNAIKFAPGGTVRVEGRFDTRAVLVVRDTGVGMDPADIPRALTPFRQLDSGLERKYDGTGLGLPLCKRLVELHQGTLEIDSAIGEGTEISVCLPGERMITPPACARLESTAGWADPPRV